jgi:hypothetical protein
MKINRDYSLVLDIEHAKPLKRFLCFIFDAVLFLILSSVIFGLIGQPIISNLSGFKKNNQLQENSVQIISNLYLDSKLSIRDSNGNFSNEIALKKYTDNKLNDVKTDGENTTDIFVYFYTTYTDQTLAYNGVNESLSVKEVNEQISKINQPNNPIIWELDNGDINLPVVLTYEAKTEIKRYKNNEIDAKSELFYFAFDKHINEMMNEAGSKLLTSDQYINATQTYNESYYSVLSYYSYSSFIIYTISFILYYVLIPLLFKDGKTIAKFCLGYGIFTKDRKYVKNNIVVLRSVLQYISYFFFVTLIPFLHIGISCFQMPLLMFDGYILSMIIPFLFSLLLSIISFIFIATSAHYQSLHEMCSHTIVGKIITKPVNEKGDNTNGK